jgi:tRNA A-37 threonylcarbamoyl transferase component Bud32
MATVHRAQDEVLGRDVAVKTFRATSTDPRQEERRRGEMEVLARLSHPGLVRLYDVGTDTDEDGTHHVSYLVMEFVHGTDLRRRLSSGTLTPDEARDLGMDLASALAYVHGLGIVHRDIKPANILVPDAQPGTHRPAKLTDFGIARLTDASRLTLTNTTIGTANYLSPEQARGEKVGPSSDVYSLGLVLLECLTGRMEFTGGAVEAAVARLLRDPTVPEALGEPWGPLLRRMTSRNPAERPDAAEVLAVLRGEAPAAGTVPAAVLPAGAPTDVLPAADGTAVLAAHDAGTRLMAPASPHAGPGTRVTTAQQPLLVPSLGAQATAAQPAFPQLAVEEPPAAEPGRPRPPRDRRKKPGRLTWVAAAVLVAALLLVAIPLALQAAMVGPQQPAPSAPAVSEPSAGPSEATSPDPTDTAEPTPAATSSKAAERAAEAARKAAERAAKAARDAAKDD